MIPDPATRACITADEAFAELGIDRTTGYRAIKEGTFKPLPEFGSAEDFPLTQALNRLKSKPVMVSKTMAERTAETPTEQ